MCVIAYKAKKSRFPTKRNVREMWETNPDGAGVMWRRPDNSIGFAKGFMKLKHLEKWIAANRAWLEEVECALHFRITTHGGTAAGNCHPFVVREGADPHVLSGTERRVMMHNGILPFVPRSPDVSDTGELALRLGTFRTPSAVLGAMDECLKGNRIILMDDGGTHFYGDPFQKSEDRENEGILYSNLNWECGGGWWTPAKPPKDFAYGGTPLYDYFWDESGGTWREAVTNRPVRADEVDEYAISEDDYDLWALQYGESEDAWTRSQYGLSAKEFADLKREAEANGMCVEDWLYYQYGDACAAS